MINRRQILLSAPTLLAASVSPSIAATGAADPVLDGAITSPRRSVANVARDAWRHPAQTLAFWGLLPGITVVEISPGGGYWTEVLAPYLAATHGQYIAAAGGDAAAFQARFADQAVWGPITVASFTATSPPLGPAASADMVITSRNIHDWMWTPGLLAKALADFHAVLKPGAILGVEEHRADPRPMIAQAHDGYVSTAWLVDAVQQGGFRLEAQSEVNANPRDTKDHPFGVWTLPPTLRTHAKDQPTPAGFDVAKYQAIGESDRMTLRFRKA